MQAVRNRLAGEPFEVIAVNVGEDFDQVKNFLNLLDAGLDYPVLLDENLVTTKNWKVRALPTTYIHRCTGSSPIYRDWGARF